MKRYQKPMTEFPPKSDEPQTSESFDVALELEKCEEILRREVRNLMVESSRGKLSKTSATDLANYIKLLGEMKHGQEEILKETPTEALKKLLK